MQKNRVRDGLSYLSLHRRYLLPSEVTIW